MAVELDVVTKVDLHHLIKVGIVHCGKFDESR